jgi:hypothetical protein
MMHPTDHIHTVDRCEARRVWIALLSSTDMLPGRLLRGDLSLFKGRKRATQPLVSLPSDIAERLHPFTRSIEAVARAALFFDRSTQLHWRRRPQ